MRHTLTKTRTVLTTSAAAACLMGSMASAQQVFATDVIIQGSLCTGFDCVNGESFGFDTLRLKENNLRVHFNDTSTAASFPSNDWRITINDSSNGGGNYFAIEDSTAGRVPFRIEAGAPVNTLYVESDGDVGIKTANPAVDLHIVEGNTPTLRLEQDGSDGFTPQTYDVAANEANFFVRDVTNGSKLFLRAKPGAPEDSLFIAADGDVGLGTDSPVGDLHIVSSEAFAFFRLTANGATPNTDADITYTDGGADGELRFNISDGDNQEMTLDAAGNMTIDGTLTQNSDRTRKQGIVPVNTADILSKVTALPVSSWSYIDDKNPDVRHIGPMAQDFYALFGTGQNERGISSLDASGVALAAIQALAAENARLKERMEALEADQL